MSWQIWDPGRHSLWERTKHLQNFCEKDRNSMPVFCGKDPNDPWTSLTVCGKNTSGKDMNQAVVVLADTSFRTVWKWYSTDECVARLDKELEIQIRAKSWQNIGHSFCTRLTKINVRTDLKNLIQKCRYFMIILCSAVMSIWRWAAEGPAEKPREISRNCLVLIFYWFT